MNFKLARLPAMFLAALLLAPALWAEPAPQPPDDGSQAVCQAATPQTAHSGPGLWKLADEDTTIYLFGTVHALPADVKWFDKHIAAALDASDTIITEIRMDDTLNAQMAKAVSQTGYLPKGKNLRTLMSADERDAYEAAMKKIGLDAASFDAFKPWYAGMMLSMIPLLQQGYANESGVESVLLARAKDKHKGALETIAEQFGFFDQLPEETQLNFLITAAKNNEELKPTLDAIVAKWLAGDAKCLAQLMNEDLEDATLADRLLYQRNRNWAAWIAQRMEQPGTLFIAVGAGHLAGAKSVQSYLAARHLKVERVE